MKFTKMFVLAITCSLLITSSVFAGQKYINAKNGYEINLIDGDISAMSSDFALTMDSKTQTAYFVGGINDPLGKFSTVKFNNLYASFANVEKLQGGGPLVVNYRMYKFIDELFSNTHNENIQSLLSTLKQVEFTCTTSNVNELSSIHFKIAKLNNPQLGKKLPIGVNDFYLVSENNVIYILGTFTTQNLPSKETKRTFSKFLKSFKTIKPSNINKGFGYTDAIAGYYLPLPKDWWYVQGKLGKLSNFTIAMPLDSIFATGKTLKDMDKTIVQGPTEQATMVKNVIKAANEGIIAFSSRNPLNKKGVPYQVLINIRNNDTEYANFFVEQFKNNIENELNKYNVSTNYIAAVTDSDVDVDKDLIINLKSELLYDKNFPLIFNSKIYINNNFLGNISYYFKQTTEKSAQNSNSALIRHIDKLHLGRE